MSILGRARDRLPAAYRSDGGILNRYQRTPTQHPTGYSYDTIKYHQRPWDIGNFVTSPLGILETNNAAPTQYTYRTPVVEEVVDTPASDNDSSDLIQTPIVEDPVVDPNIISTVPDEDLTGLPGQDNQYVNPDINYEDAYVADNNQIVGVLDPSEENLETASEWVDPSFYTDPENPIYSASDFELGSSTEGTDYVTDYSTDEDNETDIFVNDSGSTVDIGYGVGEVDPGLAEAAGYTPPDVEINEPVFEDPVSDIPVIPPTYVELPTTEIPDNYIDPGLLEAVAEAEDINTDIPEDYIDPGLAEAAGIDDDEDPFEGIATYEPEAVQEATDYVQEGYEEAAFETPTPEPTPVPEWEQAGYSSSSAYNNRLEAREWDELETQHGEGIGVDQRGGYDQAGNWVNEYRYGDTVYDNYQDATYAKNLGEADPTETTYLGDTNGDGINEYAYGGKAYDSRDEAKDAYNQDQDWHQEGYESEYQYDNRLGAAEWDTADSNGISSLVYYDDSGNYNVVYEKNGKVFNNYADPLFYGTSNAHLGSGPIGNKSGNSFNTTAGGDPKYIDIGTGSGSDDSPSAAALAAASVSSDNTQVQHDYSGPSHGYDEAPTTYSPPSTPSYDFGSNYYYSGGGIIKRANQGGIQQSPYRGILMNKLNRRKR